MDLKFGVISPQDWGLPVATPPGGSAVDDLGVSLAGSRSAGARGDL